ncbi:hypothetical protein MMC07_002069 [Pseudocyphellaria aurata]|nr:hypothetical protein [Pseudocyphellaria aurata]
MSSLTSSRIEAWRNQIESPEPPRGRTRKRAFEMDNRPDLPYREHGPFEGQEPSRSRSSSPRKRQRRTPPQTTVSRDASTDVCFPPPSQTTSRGNSPKGRTKRWDLSLTEPTFVTGSGKSIRGDIITPDPIRALVRLFEEEECTFGCVPASIFDEVQEISQDMAKLPARSRGEEDGQDHSTLLQTVKDLYDYADGLFSNNRDESTWYPLVLQILTYGLNKNSLLSIVPAQTKFMCQDLLPRSFENEQKPISTVKVDFILHFNTENSQVCEALNPRLRGKCGNLSAFKDSDTTKAFSLSVVEVKPVGGDYADALYQVMVASAAMQQRLIQLQAGCSKDSLQHQYHHTLPVIGLIVVGHFWYLHIAFRSSGDCVVRILDEALFISDTNIQLQRVLGPYRCGGTSSYLDIFRLFKIIDKLKQWGSQDYWKFLQETIADR